MSVDLYNIGTYLYKSFTLCFCFYFLFYIIYGVRKKTKKSWVVFVVQERIKDRLEDFIC